MADIFKEVEEDLRREKFERLWKRYGNYLIALAAAIVITTAATVFYRQYRENQALELSDRFADALFQLESAAGDRAAAEQALSEIAAAGGGYGALAGLQEAAAKLAAGDTQGAAAIYDRLAAGDTPAPLKDLAKLLKALALLDSGEPSTLIADLAPLTAEDNPWRFSAREITALLADRAGDRTQAIELLKALADDLAAPQSLRQRATELVAAWGGAGGGQ